LFQLCRYKYKLIKKEDEGSAGYKLVPEADLPGSTPGERVFNIQQAGITNFLHRYMHRIILLHK
jgi:hypothetical protein